MGKLKKNVVVNYGPDYQPPQQELNSPISSPVWKPALKAVSKKAEELNIPRKAKLNDIVSSSCYGIASPDVAPKKEIKVPEPRMKMGTATTTLKSIEQLSFPLNHHDEEMMMKTTNTRTKNVMNI